jgi:trehalose utilization protein
MGEKIKVTIWNEFRHERQSEKVAKVYPDGIHRVLANFLHDEGCSVATATLDQPQNGLTESLLDTTDVLLWWGHMAHDKVQDDIVERVHKRVLDGMGLIILHSAHFSKIFKRLMGTSCDLKWRESGEKERIWVVAPGHPIATGLEEYFEIPQAEMYGETFDIPSPDELIFISWFQGGEIFRSGCCFYRGKGKIFYYRPGHETYPIYYQAEVRQVIKNAVHWAAPVDGPALRFGHHPNPLEKKQD